MKWNGKNPRQFEPACRQAGDFWSRQAKEIVSITRGSEELLTWSRYIFCFRFSAFNFITPFRFSFPIPIGAKGWRKGFRLFIFLTFKLSTLSSTLVSSSLPAVGRWFLRACRRKEIVSRTREGAMCSLPVLDTFFLFVITSKKNTRTDGRW